MQLTVLLAGKRLRAAGVGNQQAPLLGGRPTLPLSPFRSAWKHRHRSHHDHTTTATATATATTMPRTINWTSSWHHLWLGPPQDTGAAGRVGAAAGVS